MSVNLKPRTGWMGQVMLTHEQDGNLETLFSCRLYKSETVFEGDVVEKGSLGIWKSAKRVSD